MCLDFAALFFTRLLAFFLFATRIILLYCWWTPLEEKRESDVVDGGAPMYLCRGCHRRRSRYYRLPREWRTTPPVSFVSLPPYFTISLVGGILLGRFLLEYVFCSLPVFGVFLLSFPRTVALCLMVGASVLSAFGFTTAACGACARHSLYTCSCAEVCVRVCAHLFFSHVPLLFLMLSFYVQNISKEGQ